MLKTLIVLTAVIFIGIYSGINLFKLFFSKKQPNEKCKECSLKSLNCPVSSLNQKSLDPCKYNEFKDKDCIIASSKSKNKKNDNLKR